jgi:hypothetical protein
MRSQPRGVSAAHLQDLKDAQHPRTHLKDQQDRKDLKDEQALLS